MAQQSPTAASESGTSASPAAVNGVPQKAVRFMDKAASSGQFEVAAAKLAETKSSDPAITAFAKRMVNDHTKADGQLRDIAQRKNVNLPTALDPKDQQLLQKLNQASQGRDFDTLYVKDMLKTHKKAVQMFKKAAAHCKDPEVKAYAANTLPTLEDHLRMAESLKHSENGSNSDSGTSS
jgi:putative membrane protein